MCSATRLVFNNPSTSAHLTVISLRIVERRTLMINSFWEIIRYVFVVCSAPSRVYARRGSRSYEPLLGDPARPTNARLPLQPPPPATERPSDASLSSHCAVNLQSASVRSMGTEHSPRPGHIAPLPGPLPNCWSLQWGIWEKPSVPPEPVRLYHQLTYDR